MDLDRNLRVNLLELDYHKIELLEIFNRELPSPIDYVIYDTKKIGNGIPYHLCYETQNIVEEYRQLRQKGFCRIKDASFSCIFQTDVMFLMHKEMGLMELIERK